MKIRTKRVPGAVPPAPKPEYPGYPGVSWYPAKWWLEKSAGARNDLLQLIGFAALLTKKEGRDDASYTVAIALLSHPDVDEAFYRATVAGWDHGVAVTFVDMQVDTARRDLGINSDYFKAAEAAAFFLKILVRLKETGESPT